MPECSWHPDYLLHCHFWNNILFLVSSSLCMNVIGTLLICCIAIFEIIYWCQNNKFWAWFYFRRLIDDKMFMIICQGMVPTTCYVFFGFPIFIGLPTYSVGKASNWRRSDTINIFSQRTCKYISIKCIFLFGCFLVSWSLLNILCSVLNFSSWMCQWQCFLILNFGPIYLCQYNWMFCFN